MMLSNLETKPNRVLSFQTELKEKRILPTIAKLTLNCGLLNPINVTLQRLVKSNVTLSM